MMYDGWLIKFWILAISCSLCVIQTHQEASIYSCPSFCDDDNYYHKETPCPIKSFCCKYTEHNLQCCFNTSLALKEGSIQNNHNCYNSPVAEWLATYWKIVLGVCLPVGVLSVIAAVTLCSLQNTRLRRRNQLQVEMDTRTRSNSAVSARSGSSASSGRSSGPVVVVTPEESTISVMDIHMVNLDAFQPPPYISEKPPEYTVFP